MPMAWVRGYLKMLTRLDAEERLKMASVVAYGNGNMSEADAAKYARGLRVEAGIEAPRKRATNADLRSLFGGGK